ncbi:MAG: tetratricopeptide repeat protein [Candidatus Heimdallarchaeaceae archaeon]
MQNPHLLKIKNLFDQSKYKEILEKSKNKEFSLDDRQDSIYFHHILAQTYYKLGEIFQALNHIQSANKLREKLRLSIEEKTQIDITYSKILRRVRREKEGMEILNTLEKKYYSLIPDELKTTILHNKANFFLEQGKLKQAKKLLLKAKAIDEQNNNLNGLSLTYSSIGALFFYNGEFEEAISYYKKSLQLRKKSKDILGEATVLFNIGSILISMQKEDEALEVLNKAELIFREYGHNKGVLSVFDLKGEIYFKLRKYQKTINYLIYLEKEKNDVKLLKKITLTNILAHSLYVKGDYERVESLLDRVITLIFKKDALIHSFHLVEILKTIELTSFVKSKINKIDEAFGILTQSEKTLLRYNLKQKLTPIYYIKSKLLSQNEKLLDALKYAIKAQKLSEKYEDPALILVLDQLFEVNLKLKRFQECVKILKKLTRKVDEKTKVSLLVLSNTFNIILDKKVQLSEKIWLEHKESQTVLLLAEQLLINDILQSKRNFLKNAKLFLELSVSKLYYTCFYPLILIAKQVNESREKRGYDFEFEKEKQSKLLIMYSKILQNQILCEEIREFANKFQEENQFEFQEYWVFLDLLFVSIIEKYLSKDYILKMTWGESLSIEEKKQLLFKQEIYSKILTNQLIVEGDMGQLTEQNQVFSTIFLAIISKLDSKGNFSERKKLITKMLATDVVLRSLNLIGIGASD